MQVAKWPKDAVTPASSSNKVKCLFFFCFSEQPNGPPFALFLAPSPDREILDYLAHCPIIWDYTVDTAVNISIFHSA